MTAGARRERWGEALALALLVLLPFALFFPALAYGRLIYGFDTLAMEAPLHVEIQRALAAHQWPLWMPDLYGGMPGIAACNLMFIYPLRVFGILARMSLQAVDAWDCAVHGALAGVGMFLFLRRLDRSVGAALLGALCFAISGSELSQVYGGYEIYVEGIAWVPWAFWAAHKGWKEGSWAAWGLCGLAFGLQILADAAQLFIYTAVAVAAFVLLQARADEPAPWAARRGPALQGLALALALAFLVSAPQLWMTLQYLPLADRHGFSLGQILEGSIGLQEAVTWLVPGFFGWHSPYYDGPMGDCFTTEYFGLLPWALAAAAVAALWRRDRRVRWMVGLALTAIFFAQRHWVPFYWVFRHLPVLSGFRLWSRILFLVTFAVCSLAAFGWDALRDEGLRRRAWLGAAAYCGLALGVAGLAWAWAGHRALADTEAVHGFSTGLDPARTTELITAMARDSAWTALTLLPVLLALLWVATRRWAAGLALALVLLFHVQDQWQALRQFVHFVDPGILDARPQFLNTPPPPPAVEPQRVLDLDFYSNASMGLGFEGLGGRESMMMKGFTGIMRAMDGRKRDFFALFNARYVLMRSGPGGGQVKVVSNPTALPRAWLVTRSRRVAGDEEAFRLLADPAFDPRVEAALEQGPVLRGRPPKGGVGWLERTPLGEALDVDTDQAAVLMISNSWYPSWRCRVDGQDAPVLRADGGLQAVVLEPGRHQVAIRFDQGLFYDALAACLAGLVAVLGTAFMPGGPGRRGDEADSAEGARP